MAKPALLRRLLDPGLIAIVRADAPGDLVQAGRALLAGGVNAMEVTMTTPGALDAVRAVTAALGDSLLMGVGSVLDPETARLAHLAGAQFVVTPVVRPAVIALCNRYGLPVICGATTPTEALAAHEAGADFVKIFPAEHFGPSYIKSILAPLPMLQVIPTGGVTPENAPIFLQAGCVALGIGSGLVSPSLLATGDWPELTRRAAAYVAAAELPAMTSPVASA
jgi:2-dehydro-3-deoxyphosphogluconate aldolase/(4S)-4-hydroxy-2-oxoglutarate aldolase